MSVQVSYKKQTVLGIILLLIIFFVVESIANIWWNFQIECEFEDNENKIVSYRKVPELHVDIIKFSKLRCPVNHPAVMYKKSIVQKTGGYKKMMWFEDYYLWARMILNGAKFYNIQESLVNVRAGVGQLERRRGLKYALSELKLQRKMLKLGFLSWFEFSTNVIIRFSIRMLPEKISTFIYSMIRKL